jgi:hypothetical protein
MSDIDHIEDPTIAETKDDTASDRRSLLRKVAIGGAGAAAASLAIGRTASAADGDPLLVGQTTTATAPTVLGVTPAAPVAEGPSALSVGAAAPPATAPFPASVGGYGNANYANGLHGSTVNPKGFGVVAANLAPAVAATEDAPAALAIASSGAHIKLLAGAKSGPSDGKHGAGELYVDKDGTLWFTVPAPTPTDAAAVRFVKLAGSSTAGSFHALPIAERIYDTRTAAGAKKLEESTQIDIDLTKKEDGTNSAFPAGARLAVLNIAITQTEVAGFIVLFATGTPIADVKTANINWSEAGVATANSATIPVSAAGKVTARLGAGTSDTLIAKSHLIVDLVGYYL